jgi:hypothetical protein
MPSQSVTEILKAIVDGRADGTLSMSEAVDLARNAGLIVDGGDPEDAEFMIYFVDPATNQTVLTVSSASAVRADPHDATDPMVNGKPDKSGHISCEYEGVRYVFDRGGVISGLAPGGNYRLVVDSEVPFGLETAAAGCNAWNDALPGTFRQPEARPESIKGFLLSAQHGVITVRCIPPKEITVPPDRGADTSVNNFLGQATATIRVDCGMFAQQKDQLVRALEHECGHVLGVAHSDPNSNVQPVIMRETRDVYANAGAGPFPIADSTAQSIKHAWARDNAEKPFNCVKGFDPAAPASEGGGDPCAGDPCSAGCPDAASSCTCNPSLPGCFDACAADACSLGCPNANTCSCNSLFCTPCDVDPVCCGDPACQCQNEGGTWDGVQCLACSGQGCAYCSWCLAGGCPELSTCSEYLEVCGCYS